MCVAVVSAVNCLQHEASGAHNGRKVNRPWVHPLVLAVIWDG